MKLLLSISLTFFTAFQLVAQGIEFFHGTLKEALEEADKLGKPIFVDAYAKWCGPCKRMAATTFKDESVGEFFNKNFINMKIDMEEGEGLTFRKKYPVSAFPTLFFIDGKGEIIHKVVGGQTVEGILQVGGFALGKVDYSREYAAEYEKGNREPELIFNYVKSLNKSHKPSLGISNEYLRSQEDLTTEFNLRFIHEAAVEADSRIFGLLIKYQKEIGMLVGLDGLKERIALACENTADKAIEFQSIELLEEAEAKMKAHYPERADAFAAKSDMAFYKAAKDAKNYGKACNDYAKTANGDPKELHKMADEIATNFGTDDKCMKLAEKYAKEAAQNGKRYEYYLTYANILMANGKKKQAVEAANDALDLAKAVGPPAEQEVQMFIKRLES
ncbi:MAG: thioredoxin family protein [Lewinellaceae bacterium]|nr:thioredoxin family protein [Saprospiraceae bacterium]MCB9337697.1 thioredoxin family protein [Lewinellaceae bacterium]